VRQTQTTTPTAMPAARSNIAGIEHDI